LDKYRGRELKLVANLRKKFPGGSVGLCKAADAADASAWQMLRTAASQIAARASPRTSTPFVARQRRVSFEASDERGWTPHAALSFEPSTPTGLLDPFAWKAEYTATGSPHAACSLHVHGQGAREQRDLNGHEEGEIDLDEALRVEEEMSAESS
jgi:hypothetical protein